MYLKCYPYEAAKYHLSRFNMETDTTVCIRYSDDVIWCWLSSLLVCYLEVSDCDKVGEVYAYLNIVSLFRLQHIFQYDSFPEVA
jgi:hypothetical protein